MFPCMLSRRAMMMATRLPRTRQMVPIQAVATRQMSVRRERYPRTRPYPLKKQYRVIQYKKLFEQAQWVVAFQPLCTDTELDVLKNKLDGKVRFKGIKNRIVQVALEGSKYEALAGVFAGPTELAYCTNEETSLKDLQALLNVDGRRDRLLWLGGAFENQVLAHPHLLKLKSLPYAEHAAHTLVAMLQMPTNNIVNMLNYPTQAIVKTLDFKAKEANQEAA